MSHGRALRSLATTLLLGSGLVACGGADRPKAVPAAPSMAAACDHGDTTANYMAVRGFITATTPTPQRFLTPAGTDSAAPEDGFRAMQDKGPSYFYGGDAAAQRKIREKLASVGPFASLLIVMRDRRLSAGGDTLRMTLGGRFIGGDREGQVVPSRMMVVACHEAKWQVVSFAEVATEAKAP